MVAVVRWDGDGDAILVSVTSRLTAIQLRWQRGRLADTVGHLGGTTAAHQELAGGAKSVTVLFGGSIVWSRCSRMLFSDNEVGGG